MADILFDDSFKRCVPISNKDNIDLNIATLVKLFQYFFSDFNILAGIF